jgi:hypothetical protein
LNCTGYLSYTHIAGEDAHGAVVDAEYAKGLSDSGFMQDGHDEQHVHPLSPLQELPVVKVCPNTTL